MGKLAAIIVLGVLFSMQVNSAPAVEYRLVIHGGAGAMPRAELTLERETEIRSALDAALRAGASILDVGGSSLDAVTASIVVLEDAPWFNAGKGAVFTHDGHNELDASIMDGHSLKAGAVAGVRHVRNPVKLAREVMQSSSHVMLTGEGAEAFARTRGIEPVDPAYFRTEERWQQLQKFLANEKKTAEVDRSTPSYLGTVGAVALDRKGHLAAGTSTGGMTGKRWGRVGDAPIIGAGTYANDRCAVSATGWGEFFIRAVVAHDICARVAYRGDSIEAAANEVVLRTVPGLGGDGGVIALGRDGSFATPFNTAGMYRGWIGPDGEAHTEIYPVATKP